MNNLTIEFNANIIKKVKSLHFQVDQLGSVLFILFSLYEEKYDLLDEFDDYNKERRAFILYKELETRGLVTQNPEKNTKAPHYILTKEGVDFVEFVKSEFTSLNETVTSETIAVAGVEELKTELSKGTVHEWIDEWIEIFPRSIRSGGKLLRSDKPSCVRKMVVFMREYKYTPDVILEATRAYINDRKQNGYNYTRCAVYFIYRTEGSVNNKSSDLATWCEQVLHDRTTPQYDSENNLEIMA